MTTTFVSAIVVEILIGCTVFALFETAYRRTFDARKSKARKWAGRIVLAVMLILVALKILNR